MFKIFKQPKFKFLGDRKSLDLLVSRAKLIGRVLLALDTKEKSIPMVSNYLDILPEELHVLPTERGGIYHRSYFCHVTCFYDVISVSMDRVSKSEEAIEALKSGFHSAQAYHYEEL